MATPTVSIVIPCYNQPEVFLRECLESVRGQTLDDWEAIVVDDASTVGNVAAVVAGLNDRRITVLRHPENRGEGAARNSGFSAARSDLVASLDPDDRWDPRFLEATLDALRRDPRADWVLTDRRLFGGSDGTLRFPDPLPPPCPLHFNAGAPGLIRRRVWERVGGFSEDGFGAGGVDFDFWLGSVECGVKAIHVGRLLYWYRVHDASASATSLPYDSYRINDALYLRHRRLFSATLACPRCTSRRRAAVFRASGYRTSARASLARGERWRAIRLATRAVSLDPADPTNVKQLGRSLVPRSAIAAEHRFLGRWRRKDGVLKRRG